MKFFKSRARPPRLTVPRVLRFFGYAVLLAVAWQRLKKERAASLRRYEEKMRRQQVRRRQSFP
ncbi:protein US34A [Panine betaherpesvirus 2]|uniref:Protein US34A n=1 Tax=Panine betaherpesvirus 2 TaxID=188763 RepID=Q8QRS6_9BETA|nr:protein US34A [Panine betaherpesvirus 2]AAM00812.1 protein US34A [Panine betaherpesvirus 2]QXV67931.1 protein US34A [Panine betaherpesvirus 2]